MKDYKRLTEKTKLGTYTIGVENETKMIKRLGELEDLIDRTRFVFLAKGRGNGKSSESVKLIEELAEFGVTEKDALELCKKYDLLSPTYNSNFRGGCWFCPNGKIAEFAKTKQDHPSLWAELKKMSQEPNTVSKIFCWGKTFDEIERKVDLHNNQISMWEE